MSYQVLVVDDEALARQRMQRLLQQQAHFTVAGEAEHGEAALAWLKQNKADIVLLDIQMPGLNGLDTAALIQKLPNSPVIIFCTAYDEHALEAFRVQALDYLLKPVRPEDLTRALMRAEEWLLSVANTANPAAGRTHLTANSHKGLERVAIADVIACIAEHKYVGVLHEGGKLLVEESLKQLEEEFPQVFIRTHRSALVATNRLYRLQSVAGGHQVYLHGLTQPVAVSRRHLAKVKSAMAKPSPQAF